MCGSASCGVCDLLDLLCSTRKNLSAGTADYPMVKSYIQNRNASDLIRVYVFIAILRLFVLMSFTYVFVSLYAARDVAHLLSISRPFKPCGDELSAAAQAFKTCANELSAIAQARKSCANELPPIAQSVENMCR